MFSDLQTIFARASGVGRTAVTVVRLSGPTCLDILNQLCASPPPARRASLRRLRDPGSGALLDEGLVLWFPGPHSYTGEDSAELHLHGGSAVFDGVANTLLSLGCRPAEPGEFTRRAVLFGKLDLLQAEAIADLIEAQTGAQVQQALRQHGGALSRLYEDWTARMTRILAHQEAAIEFALDDLPTNLDDQARLAAAALTAEITAHLGDGRRGERLREGLSIAIIGAPNAGKSSLLNALVGRPAAIVSAQPGTTRDVVECRLDLDGVPATIADTAGLRSTVDEVESEGVRRARLQAEDADLLLTVFAVDQPPDAETLAMLAARPDALVVMSKCDLGGAPDQLGSRVVLKTSAQLGLGIGGLRAALAAEAERRAGLSEAPAITRLRHRATLTEAVTLLADAQRQTLPELVAESYRAALQALGRLTGRVHVETVLDDIFRDFCIGK
jgi:tRNA modification GTPase